MAIMMGGGRVMPQKMGEIQSPKKVFVRGLVNFVPAVAYLFCLNLPAAFSQPRTRTFFGLCTCFREFKNDFRLGDLTEDTSNKIYSTCFKTLPRVCKKEEIGEGNGKMRYAELHCDRGCFFCVQTRL